ADLHPLKQGDALDIVDGYAILERESSVVSAQGKTAVWSQTPHKDSCAAAGIGLPHMTGISTRSSVKLAIANGDCVAAHVQNLFALAQAKLPNDQWRRVEFLSQGNLVAPDQRLLVKEEFQDWTAGKGPAGQAITKL